MFQNDITDPYGAGNLVGGDAAGTLQLMKFLQLQGQDQTPIPYSPEGWSNKQVLGETKGGEAPAPAADKKKAGPMLTADQARVIQSLTTPGPMPHAPGAVSPGALKSVAPQMAQLTLPQAVGPRRQSLGNLIYGKG